MKKRRWLRWLIWSAVILLLVAAITEFFLPHVRYAIVGYCRGEHFYHGLPSSFYRDVIVNRWQSVGRPTGFTLWRAQMQDMVGIEPPSAIYWDVFGLNDPNELPVLEELANDPDPDVRRAAGELRKFP